MKTETNKYEIYEEMKAWTWRKWKYEENILKYSEWIENWRKKLMKMKWKWRRGNEIYEIWNEEWWRNEEEFNDIIILIQL